MPIAQGSIIWEHNHGDERIIQQLFQDYHLDIVYYACQYVSPPDAEEITSDSFLKLWRLRYGFDHVKKVRAFLYTTTHNGCIDLLRKQRKEKERLDHLPPATLFPDMNEADIERAEVEAAVLRKLYEAIQQLKGRKKEIGLLAFEQGLTNEEISRLLSLQPQVVRNRKWQVVQWLKNSWLKLVT
jgi:RNA polymerase sigma-70 factor (ECF subfamily)